jgi:hypothetical protein
MRTALSIRGERLSSFSMGCGATFLPPAVTMRSFFRSVMLDEPVLVDLGDIAGQEVAVVVEDLGGLLGQVSSSPDMTLGSLDAQLAVVGDLRPRPRQMALPIVPIRVIPGSAPLTPITGEVSVSPYPSRIRTPIEWKNSLTNLGSGAPPETQNRTRPPRPSRTLDSTSLSARP